MKSFQESVKTQSAEKIYASAHKAFAKLPQKIFEISCRTPECPDLQKVPHNFPQPPQSFCEAATMLSQTFLRTCSKLSTNIANTLAKAIATEFQKQSNAPPKNASGFKENCKKLTKPWLVYATPLTSLFDLCAGPLHAAGRKHGFGHIWLPMRRF